MLTSENITIKHFATRKRYKNGVAVGYDRALVGLAIHTRRWLLDLFPGAESTHCATVFMLGVGNVVFAQYGGHIHVNVNAGAQALEYVSAWQRMNNIDSACVHYGAQGMPTAESAPRGGGVRRTLESVLSACATESALNVGI